MKCIRGLWRAIGSTSPRNALSDVKYVAPVTTGSSSALVRWKSSGLGYHRPQEEHAINEPPASESTGSPAQTHSGASTSAGLIQPMRNVMRQLPHPVVVITTLDRVYQPQEQRDLDTDNKYPIPRAMTVSSFTSLTIDPVPHVTFNVTLPSRTHRALEACGTFNAHILEGNDHGARVADRFTRGNLRAGEEDEDKDGLGILAGLGDLGVEVLGREEWQAEWQRARDGRRPALNTVPMLRGRGVLHVLKCRYAQLLSPLSFGADRHAIVIGEVTDIDSRGSGAAHDGGLALAYADRAYRSMGEQLLNREPGQGSAERVATSADEGANGSNE